MSDKVFTIICAVISFLLSLIGSYVLFQIQSKKAKEESAYNNFYYNFYALWNKIHQARAFNYYDLKQEDQEKIANFLFENELYADSKLRSLIYQLKCCRLNNFNNNDEKYIKYANNAYNEIVYIILKREEKLRDKYIKIYSLK